MLADRVKETSTTTGSGTLTLGGAAAGFQTFAAGVGNGNKCHYVIENATVPGEWEIGIGTVTVTPDQLSRDTVISSSNGGSLVNFSAGTKSVFVSAIANNFEADITDALGSVSGSVTLKVNHYQTITATIGGATTFSFDGWPSAGTPKRSVILTNGGSASVTWPTITWVDGSAPTLQTTGVDRVDIWRTGGVVYGKLIKQATASGGVTATVTLADNVTVGDFVAALNSGSVEKVKQTIVTTPSVGTAVVFESDNISYISAVYDSANGKIVIAYRDSGNSNFGTAIVGTVSGTSISFGTAVVFEPASTAWCSAVYNSANGKIVIAYQDTGNGNFGTAIVGTVSGTSISFGTAVVFESANTSYISAVYDSANGKIVIAYQGQSTNLYGTSVVLTSQSTSSNSSDVIGVATETKTAGQTCLITPLGAVDSTTSGLSVGQDYYITGAGVRTTTAGTNTYVGRALSATQLMLRSIAKR